MIRPDDDPRPVDFRDLLKRPEPDWQTNPDFRAALDNAKKESEVEDIEAFLAAYPRATGEELNLVKVCESPDAVCTRPDGSIVGVEITTVRRSPEMAFLEATDHRDEMDCEEAFDEIVRLTEQKARVRPKFTAETNILVLAICESDFARVVSLACLVPVEDWAAGGFAEIWLADFRDIRNGAHREVRLFGLYPEHYRTLTGRSEYDQKPYG